MSQPLLDFTRRIQDLTEVFVGREWLLKEVDDFLRGKGASYLVITGEPGIGKSALAAHLIQVQKVHAYHFCQAREGGTLDPVAFVRSLSRQLARGLPGFGQAVVEQEAVQIHVRVEVGEMHGGEVHGVTIDRFVGQAKSADEAFQTLVRLPLKAWAEAQPPGEQVVILVDALDEALRLDRRPNILDLIDTARDLPPTVRWLLTSRPGEHLLVLPAARLVILDDSAENLSDVRTCVRAALAEPQVAKTLRAQGRGSAALEAELARRSGGNFLYLRYVLARIREAAAAREPIAAPDRLPAGMDGLYREFLDRVLARKDKGDWQKLYRPLLGVLAAAQEAVSFKALAALSGAGPQEVNDVLIELDQLLDTVGEGRAAYRIYHTSFADFLTSQERNPAYWIDPAQQHQRIAEHYLVHYAGDWPACDGYGLRHLPAHLARAGRTEDLRWLLCDFDWLKAKLDAADPSALIADYDLALAHWVESEGLSLIQAALRLSTHFLAEDKAQLAAQLLGRLLSFKGPKVEELLEGASAWRGEPWLRPLHPSLEPPGGALLRTLPGHKDGVMDVAVTPGGERAVSASKDRMLMVWNLGSGTVERTLTGHEAEVLAVAITPDGKRAVSASEDSTLKVWQLENGKVERTLAGHEAEVLAVAITPDGKRAVSASKDRTLKVWNLRSGAVERTLTGQTEWVNGVAVTPDGKRAILASEDSTLKVWNLKNGEVERTLDGHVDWVYRVAVAPDGERVVSASGDGTLKVWNLLSGAIERTLEGHTNWVYGVAVTPDGQRVVSAGSDGTLKVWNLHSGAVERTLEGHVYDVWAVAVTPDGKRAVSASEDGTLKVWSLAAGAVDQTLERHSDRVRGIAVKPDGKLAMSASEDGTLKVWNLHSGKVERTLAGHARDVKAVAITPDGKRAVSASGDWTLKVWNLKNGKIERTLTGHTGWVNGVAITPDGKQAVSASDDRTLKVWNLKNGKIEHTLAGHKDWVNGVAVTPDGKRGVSASADRTLKVWNRLSGTAERTLEGHEGVVFAVAVTPDGQRVVSASADRTLKVWNLLSGSLERTLEGHTDSVYGVAITPDGQRAASAAYDGMLKVWDLASGSCLATFRAEYAVCCCVFAPDGRTIAAGDAGGKVHILRFEADRVVRRIKNQAGKGLLTDER